ncbi:MULTISPECIES: hypothetical protein [Sphingomonas]|uniref:hypothetical protein n=1 Tax=Sphingomonas TaxID=13687 RepID=UPI0012E24517|nr:MULTISPECIES: hypothetical protein [Sphingomonas]MDY0967390.1 hypothetical protein [Sphingomonas sp. CFBP9021]USR01089.1 hypothetical protein NEF64_04330 [Sphingomonas aerolata]
MAEFQIEHSRYPGTLDAAAKVGIVHTGRDPAEEVEAEAVVIAGARQAPLCRTIIFGLAMVTDPDCARGQGVDRFAWQRLDHHRSWGSLKSCSSRASTIIAPPPLHVR